MKREQKDQLINSLAEELKDGRNFYITDISTLTVDKTNQLRRLCFNKGVSVKVVKNSLIQKALEKTGADYSQIFSVLKGSSALMFSEITNMPAKAIKEFRKDNSKPVLKAAYIESSFYIGDNQLDTLSSLKSKNELIAEIVMLLQSPAKNVLGALQSGRTKISGIVKTLSERKES